MQLPMMPQDKANHYAYGSIAAAISAYLLMPYGVNGQAAAMLGSSTAGAVKEVSDWVLNYLARRDGKLAPHGVEWLDFIATTAGGIPVAAVL